MLLASEVMWAACVGVQHLPIYPHGASKTIWAAQLGLLVGAGAIVYFGVCAGLGMNVIAGLLPKKRIRV